MFPCGRPSPLCDEMPGDVPCSRDGLPAGLETVYQASVVHSSAVFRRGSTRLSKVLTMLRFPSSSLPSSLLLVAAVALMPACDKTSADTASPDDAIASEDQAAEAAPDDASEEDEEELETYGPDEDEESSPEPVSGADPMETSVQFREPDVH